MDKLTPTARLTHDALRTSPGNVHELCERTSRSRSATDKALAELSKANLIVKVDTGSDPADGAPTRWQLANPTQAGDDITQPEADTAGAVPRSADEPRGTDAAATNAETSDPAASGESATDAEPTDQAASDTGDRGDRGDEAGPVDPASPPDGQPADGTKPGDASAAVMQQPDGQPAPQSSEQEAEQPGNAEQVKTCRGCQAQMPTICPCCWQKSPAYCGTCRKDMPQARRGEPGEPVLLSNGLPKLRPGELEAMVEKVLREHPIPHHVGVTGWTSGRVAVFLPGRSPGAISNALRKLANTDRAELVGDNPERYRLTGADQSNTAVSTDTSTDISQSPAALPADDAAKAATASTDATA